MTRKHSAIALLGAFLPLPALAQSLDYDALAQLFGEPITTSVTGSPLRGSDAPASMTIIDADEIRRSGAYDLPGLLRHVTGLDVLQTTNDHADVSARGYNQAFSPRMLVLVDGRQVYADYYGFTPWSTIPVELNAIRQIEVVRGPNSALFGFNAVGGVINIITYDPIDAVVSSASAFAGTQGLSQVSTVSSWKLGEHAGLRASFGHRRADDFSTPQPAADVGTRRGDARDALNVEAAVRIGEKVTADFEATGSDVHHTELGPVYDSGFTRYSVGSIKARVAADTALGLIEGTVYRNDMRANVFNHADPVAFLLFDNDIAVSRIQSVSKIGPRQTLRLSFEHRNNTMGTTPAEGADVFNDVDSLGAMWEVGVRADISFTTAVRIDRLQLGRTGVDWPDYSLDNEDWNLRRDETSYNLGFVWRLDDVDTVRVMIGRGVQLPSLFSLGGLVIPIAPFVYATGVPTLEPTVVMNYEAIWDRNLTAIGATLRVDVFNGRTHDLVAAVGGANFQAGLVSTPLNIGGSDASGVEISLRSDRKEGWRWGVSYTPMRINDEFDAGQTVTTTLVDFEHTTPNHVVNGNVGWAHGAWEIDGYLRFESQFDGIEADSTVNPIAGSLVSIPSYTAVDARIGYRLNDRMRLAISGQNITESQQKQTSAPDVERRVFGSFEVTF